MEAVAEKEDIPSRVLKSTAIRMKQAHMDVHDVNFRVRACKALGGPKVGKRWSFETIQTQGEEQSSVAKLNGALHTLRTPRSAETQALKLSPHVCLATTLGAAL